MPAALLGSFPWLEAPALAVVLVMRRRLHQYQRQRRHLLLGGVVYHERCPWRCHRWCRHWWGVRPAPWAAQ